MRLPQVLSCGMLSGEIFTLNEKNDVELGLNIEH